MNGRRKKDEVLIHSLFYSSDNEHIPRERERERVIKLWLLAIKEERKVFIKKCPPVKSQSRDWK
jgi:hypothetical protein